MITYHYTSFSNWEKIKKEGLVPYEIKIQELKAIMGDYPRDSYPFGIWLWTRKLKGIEHAGSIIYQMATKNEHKAVLLSVNIVEDHTLKAPDGREISISHHGLIDNLVYHVDAPSVIYTEYIAPKDIALVNIYDIEERLR